MLGQLSGEKVSEELSLPSVAASGFPSLWFFRSCSVRLVKCCPAVRTGREVPAAAGPRRGWGPIRPVEHCQDP